jgi:hypothetical protein
MALPRLRMTRATTTGNRAATKCRARQRRVPARGGEAWSCKGWAAACSVLARLGREGRHSESEFGSNPPCTTLRSVRRGSGSRMRLYRQAFAAVLAAAAAARPPRTTRMKAATKALPPRNPAEVATRACRIQRRGTFAAAVTVAAFGATFASMIQASRYVGLSRVFCWLILCGT